MGCFKNYITKFFEILTFNFVFQKLFYSELDGTKCNLHVGKVKLETMQSGVFPLEVQDYLSGVAQGIWQGLPLAHVSTTFHASSTLQFVCHHVLANHYRFTSMLYHESLIEGPC